VWGVFRVYDCRVSVVLLILLFKVFCHCGFKREEEGVATTVSDTPLATVPGKEVLFAVASPWLSCERWWGSSTFVSDGSAAIRVAAVHASFLTKHSRPRYHHFHLSKINQLILLLNSPTIWYLMHPPEPWHSTSGIFCGGGTAHGI